jgi:hypothetical protein
VFTGPADHPDTVPQVASGHSKKKKKAVAAKPAPDTKAATVKPATAAKPKATTAAKPAKPKVSSAAQ